MSSLIADKDERVFGDQAHGEHRELVKRIVTSSTFVKSPRLCSLLTYVCDLTLEGRADEISEQQIGAAVFGRSPAYDSSIDGIVRAQASRLRNRLALYFEEEGIAEPTRIVIPRGAYVPHFIPHGETHFPTESLGTSPISNEKELPSEIEQAYSALIEPSSKRRSQWLFFASLVLLLLLPVPVLLLLVHRSESKKSGATLNPLWQQLFLKDRSTLVIYADSSLVLYQRAVGRNVGLAEYLKGDYRNERSSKTGSASLTTSDLSTRRYTSVVDLEVVRALDRIAEKTGRSSRRPICARRQAE